MTEGFDTSSYGAVPDRHTDLDYVVDWGMKMIDKVLESGSMNMPPMVLATSPSRHVLAPLNREQLCEEGGVALIVEALIVPLLQKEQATAAVLLTGAWVLISEIGAAWVPAPASPDALALLAVDAHQMAWKGRKVVPQMDRGPAYSAWTDFNAASPTAALLQKAIRANLN